jgi:TonB family protein
MKKGSFISRFFHSRFSCYAVVLLVTLAWSGFAFCDEIHDAAKAIDLEKVIALLKDNPELVSIKDNMGNTPLDVAGKLVAELLQPDVLPVAVMQQWPPYTEEALKAHICPSMILQATIRANGTVDSVEVIKGMGYGMDKAVINFIAARWRFKPAIKNGVPIDMKATIEMRSRCF